MKLTKLFVGLFLLGLVSPTLAADPISTAAGELKAADTLLRVQEGNPVVAADERAVDKHVGAALALCQLSLGLAPSSVNAPASLTTNGRLLQVRGLVKTARENLRAYQGPYASWRQGAIDHLNMAMNDLNRTMVDAHEAGYEPLRLPDLPGASPAPNGSDGTHGQL